MTTQAPRRKRIILWLLLGLLLTLPLGLFAASRLAKPEVLSRLEPMAARFGLAVQVEAIHVPVVGDIALSGLSFTRLSDGHPVAHIGSLETDISLIGALLGKRRPSELHLTGLELALRWNDGLVDFSRAPGNTPSGDGTTEPLSVTLNDANIGIEFSQSTPAGPIAANAVRLHFDTLALARDAQRNLSLTGAGDIDSAHHKGPLAVSLGTDGAFSVDFPEGAQLGLNTPVGPIWLAANGFALTDTLVLRGLGLRHGDHHLAIGQTSVQLGPSSTPQPIARLLSSPGLTLTDLALTRDAERFSIGRADIALSPGPTPSRVTLADLGGTIRAPGGGIGIEGRVGLVDLGLAPLATLQQAIAGGSILDAVTALKVSEPALTLLLPPRAVALPEPTQPSDDPPPFVGNDDELPQSAPLAITPGNDLLGLLLDSGTSSRSLLDFAPPPLREGLPGLLAKVTALAPEIERASLTVKEADGPVMLALEDAAFSARLADGLSQVALKAAVLRNGAEAAHLDLTIALASDFALESVSGSASGRSLAHQLARFVPRLAVQEDADIDLAITYRRPHLENAPHHVEGRIALRNFSFEYWRIADREIRDLEAALTFDASIDPPNHRLVLSLPKIEIGAAHLTGSLDLTRRKGVPPSFVARLEMPRQDCGTAARSIPKGLIPNLPTLALEGELEFKASLDLDLANPTGLDLAVDGDGDDCRILSLGPGIDPAALRGPYIHHPREPRGVLEHIAVGPGTDEWIPATRLPEIVTLAAWVTEDRRWTEHRGVRWDLVERALKMDLDQGRFVYGGSTITQQLVKNLYLTRTKNLARKLEEAIIAWQMERILTKEEIITLYVNCIEYGPEIYGIKQAARIYFDKKVKDLDALEVAFIMGLKPYPKAGYAQFRSGKLNEWWVKRVSHVLDFMSKFGPHLLKPEDVATFAPFQPKFAHPSYLQGSP